MKMATVTILAVIAFLGSLAVADAQSRVQNGAPPGVQNGNGTSDVQSGAKTSETAPKFPCCGWSYRHIWNCTGFWDGSKQVLRMDFEEGDWDISSIPLNYTIIAPACQTGNWVGFHVSDFSGFWDEVRTWHFR
jgi:hypothetical protein